MKDNMLEQDMKIISQLNEEQKLAFLTAFAKLAGTDGHVDAEEKEFIRDAALTYGIPGSRIDEIWASKSEEELLEKVKLIDNRQAALMLIKEMCMLAHADDELSDSETLLIGKVGEAMGVSLEKIQQISNWVIDRIIWLERGKLIFEEV